MAYIRLRRKYFKKAACLLLGAALFGAQFGGFKAFAGVSPIRVIEEVEELSDDISYQVVPFGTSKSALNLPRALNVKVSEYSYIDDDEEKEAEFLDPKAYIATPSDYIAPATPADYIAPATPADYIAPATPADYIDKEGDIDPDGVKASYAKVRVSWNIEESLSDDIEYDRFSPGVYAFSASAINSAYECGEDLALITVRVLSKEASELKSRIDELPDIDDPDTDIEALSGELSDIYSAFLLLNSDEREAIDIDKLLWLIGLLEDNTLSTVENVDVAMIGDTSYATLSAAFSAAHNGDTIELIADTSLSSSITVSGKALTLTSTSDHTITGPKLSNLLTISSGATLTLSGSVIFDGSGMGTIGSHYDGSNGAIVVKGTLNINDNVKITNFNVGANAGVILLDGSNAVFNLEGGEISGNTLGTTTNNILPYSANKSGIIRLRNQTTMNMSGGKICNNSLLFGDYTTSGGYSNYSNYSNDAYLYSSSGILTYCGGTVNISGGEISNNTSFRGSAILIYGFGVPLATVNISGDAVIKDNSCGEHLVCETQVGDYPAAGAVYEYCWGYLNISGGEISGNTGNAGGGVTVESFWNEKSEYGYKAYLTMTRGKISGNTGVSGGGIYAYSTGISITGGEISGNSAILGGGIYSEGNSYEGYGTTYLKNCIITGNTASIEGGGLWLCPTGGATIYVTEGGAIFDNTAKYNQNDDYLFNNEYLNKAAAGDDVASGSGASYGLTLAARSLGGGAVSYYVDGGIGSATSLWPESMKTGNPYWSSNKSSWPYPVVDSTVFRYGPNTDTSPKEVTNSSEYLALKSSLTGEDAAEALADLVISGNKASYGGGIAANGGVEIGEKVSDSSLISIEVKKEWSGAQDGTKPGSVSVWLGIEVGDKVYGSESVVLSEQNNWTHTFAGLPKETGKFTYTVYEEDVSGYTSKVSGNITDGFTITNTYGGTPDEPDNPDTPDTPSTPDTSGGSTPSGGGGGGGGSKPYSPKESTASGEIDIDIPTYATGDSSNLAALVIVMLISLMGIYKVSPVCGKKAYRALFLIAFMASSGMAFSTLADSIIEKEEFIKLRETVGLNEDVLSGSAQADSSIVSGENIIISPGISLKSKGPGTEAKTTDSIESALAKLSALNPDFRAWIYIPGTEISYPVMQKAEDPGYYLHRDFYGRDSESGTPFIGVNSGTSTANLLIYGHHMKNGSLFADLTKYEDEAYLSSHPDIYIYETGSVSKYEVIAVFRESFSDNPDAFYYYAYAGDLSEADFNSYIESVRGKALYDTGLSASYGDKLITLSTCDYYAPDGRLVVVGKKIS